jgi:hypothetical protein
MHARHKPPEASHLTASVGCAGGIWLSVDWRDGAKEPTGNPNGERGRVKNHKAEKTIWVSPRLLVKYSVGRRAYRKLVICGIVADFRPENANAFGCGFRAHHCLGSSSGRMATNLEMAQPHVK